MQQTLYLLKNQNNYFNRKVILTGVHNLTEITSNPNLILYKSNLNIPTFSGTECEVIFNTSTNYGVMTNYPDYAVISTTLDDNTTELTRWFVMKFAKIRGEQYKVTLKRDLLADYLSNILDAEGFVEKGFVYNNNAPLLLENEKFDLNEIKQWEAPVMDNSGTAWIVGYISRIPADQEQAQPVSTSVPLDDYVDYNDLSAPIKKLIDGDPIRVVDGYFAKFVSLLVQNPPSGSDAFQFNFYDLTNGVVPMTNEMNQYNYNIGGLFTTEQKNQFIANAYIGPLDPDRTPLYPFPVEYGTAFLRSNYNAIVSAIESMVADMNDCITESTYEEVLNLQSKYIKLPSNTYVKIVVDGLTVDNFDLTINNNNSLQVALKTAQTNYNSTLNNNWWEFLRDPTTGDIRIKANKIRCHLENATGSVVSATIPTTRNRLVDSPYDMFAIPYSVDNSGYYTTGTLANKVNNDVGFQIAMAICEKFGNRIIDLQYLPYCPDERFYDYRGTQSVKPAGLVEDIDYSSIKDTDNNVLSYIFYPDKSKRQFTIKSNSYYCGNLRNIYTKITSDPTNEFKNDSDYVKSLAICDKYRLVSPNFNGIFEFNLQKNDNNVPWFNVEFYYKPYNPFIRVAPQFQGLYGQEYNDQRGLICNGDFSLPTITNEWSNYEINNKNYRNIFDREIKSIDIAQNLSRINTYTRDFMNIMSLPTYLTFDDKKGLLEMGTNILTKELSFSEQKAYKFDMFEYAIGNIKAMPNSLVNQGALTNIYKMFPIVEKYSCSESERRMVLDKLKYQGYTLNLIGKLRNYASPQFETFVKSKLFRIEGAGIDDNVASQIYEEVNKGFYVDLGGYSN